METINIEKIKEHTVSVLNEETQYITKQIHEFVRYNEYEYNKYPFNLFTNLEIKLAISKLSLNQRKKLKRSINAFRKKLSLRSANRFYHFLFKKVMKSDVRISIIYSEKQLQIIKKREKYVKARNEMMKLYNDYKQEKGDFYKKRLINNQKIQ